MEPYSFTTRQQATFIDLFLLAGLWLSAVGLAIGQTPPASAVRQLLERPQPNEAFFQQLITLPPLQLQEDTAAAGAVARKAMAIAKREERPDFLAIAYTITAKIYFIHGNFIQTLDNALIARQLAVAQHLPLVEASALASLGATYHMLGEPDSSLAMSHRCAILYGLLGDSISVAKVWSNIGIVYMNLQELDSALFYYTRAYGIISRDTGIESAMLMNNIGDILLERRQYSAALANFRRSLTLKKALGSPMQRTKTLLGIGRCLFQTGKTDSALKYYLEADALAVAYHQLQDHAELQARLADIYALQGKYSLAYETSKKARILIDSVHGLRQAEVMAHAEVKQTLAFKDRENRVLKGEIQQGQSERRTQRYLLLLTSLIVLLLLGLVYVFWRLSRERHEHLERISTLNATLEQRVEARTHDLSVRNAQLEAYADLNSHSLRSKLATLLGLLTLIDMEEQTEASQRYTAMVRKTAEELDMVVHEINAVVHGGHTHHPASPAK